MNNPKHKSFCCVYKFKPPQLECWIWPECQKLASRWFLVSCRYVTLLRHGSVKQSLNSAWKQCSKTFWILLTLAFKHCLLLAASRLTTQQTKMPFMFFKERKTLQAVDKRIQGDRFWVSVQLRPKSDFVVVLLRNKWKKLER